MHGNLIDWIHMTIIIFPILHSFGVNILLKNIKPLVIELSIILAHVKNYFNNYAQNVYNKECIKTSLSRKDIDITN